MGFHKAVKIGGWFRVVFPNGDSVFARVTRRVGNETARVEIDAPEHADIEFKPEPGESKKWPGGGREYAQTLKKVEREGDHAVT